MDNSFPLVVSALGMRFRTDANTVSHLVIFAIEPMIHRLTPILALGALLIATSGCVSHTPVSESAMFHDRATYPFHQRTMGIGVTGTYAPMQHLTREVATDEDQSIESVNPNRLSGGLYLSGYDSSGRFGAGLTLGLFTVGVDATAQLWNRNYLTAALSAPGQGQVILQHRTFNSPQLGAAVGLGYRYDTLALEDAFLYGTDMDGARVHSLGVRALSIIRAQGDTGGGIKVTAFAGYTPTVHRPVVAVTLTVGRF